MWFFSQSFSTRRCILILVVLKFTLADEKRSWKEILHTEIDEYKCLGSQPCSEKDKKFMKDQITQQMTFHIGWGCLDSVDNLVRNFYVSISITHLGYIPRLEIMRHALIHSYINARLILSKSEKDDLTLIQDTLNLTKEALDKIERDGKPFTSKDSKSGAKEQDAERQRWSERISFILHNIVASVDSFDGMPSTVTTIVKRHTINLYRMALNAVDPRSTLAHSKQFYNEIINAYIRVFRVNESKWHNKETRNEWKLSRYYNDDIQPLVEEFQESLREPPNKSS